MMDFDPFGKAAQYIPEKYLHKTIRFVCVVIFAIMLARRVREYHTFLLKPLWIMETLVFLVLVVAFLIRDDPKARSRGIREVFIPLAGGVLPFALLYTPPSSWILNNRYLILATFWWMAASTAFTVWGLWTLRRSFSITIEARSLVTTGPYRFVRHPIYLGEILSAIAVAFWRFSVINCVVLVGFVSIQLFRARWEEKKLNSIFPVYDEYLGKTWWFS
jgi:protein-S-isoprenylcysteine O-methyltransferase Ste14